MSEASNTVTTNIPVDADAVDVAVDSASHAVYVVTIDNTVSVINGATNTVTATIPVGAFPAGVAVDPARHTVYVTNEDDNTVPVITPPNTTAPVSTVTAAPGPIPPRQPTITITAAATIKTTTGTTIGTLSHVTCWNSKRVVLTLSATDAGSGVSSITSSATGAGAFARTTATTPPVRRAVSATGLTTLTYAATDHAGNIERPNGAPSSCCPA